MASLNQVELSNGENFSVFSVLWKGNFSSFPFTLCASHGARHWKFSLFPFRSWEEIWAKLVFTERKREINIERILTNIIILLTSYTTVHEVLLTELFFSCLSELFSLWAFHSRKLSFRCISEFFRDSERIFFIVCAEWKENEKNWHIMFHNFHSFHPYHFTSFVSMMINRCGKMNHGRYIS